MEKIDAKTDEQQCQFINLEYHLNLCCVKIINLSDDFGRHISLRQRRPSEASKIDTQTYFCVKTNIKGVKHG